MSSEATTESEKSGVLSGFKEFLMQGNVVELAVAVVVGTAFSKIVDSIVKGFINPLVGAIGTQDLDEYSACLKGPCEVSKEGEIINGVPLNWGPAVSATLTFLITAAVVYFLMILPMNKYKERQAAKAGPVEEPKTEVELLTEIRDALITQRSAVEGAFTANTSLGEQRSGGVSNEK